MGVPRRTQVRLLRELGWDKWTWPRRAEYIREFQRAYNLGAALAVDGIFGPHTHAAVTRSVLAHRRGEPDISPHFSLSEFACSCGGRYGSCRRIRVDRRLLVALERYRRHHGRAVPVVSGYRCPRRNRAVGGASRSQHLGGYAADIPGERSIRFVRNADAGIEGVGYSNRSNGVVHIDVRGGYRTWYYG